MPPAEPPSGQREPFLSAPEENSQVVADWLALSDRDQSLCPDDCVLWLVRLWICVHLCEWELGCGEGAGHHWEGVSPT